MMKKLVIALLALVGTLSFVPSAEAGCFFGKCKRAPRATACEPCAAPKCETQVFEETFYTPCKVVVDGECPNIKRTEVKTCTTTRVSKRCAGPCVPLCEKGGSEMGGYSGDMMGGMNDGMVGGNYAAE